MVCSGCHKWAPVPQSSRKASRDLPLWSTRSCPAACSRWRTASSRPWSAGRWPPGPDSRACSPSGHPADACRPCRWRWPGRGGCRMPWGLILREKKMDQELFHVLLLSYDVSFWWCLMLTIRYLIWQLPLHFEQYVPTSIKAELCKNFTFTFTPLSEKQIKLKNLEPEKECHSNIRAFYTDITIHCFGFTSIFRLYRPTWFAKLLNVYVCV